MKRVQIYNEKSCTICICVDEGNACGVCEGVREGERREKDIDREKKVKVTNAEK